MAQLTVKGKIIAEMPERSGTGKTGKEWRSKEYVVTEHGEYAKRVCVQVMNDKIDALGLAVGQEVEIQCDVDAREWNGKWFNSITCWKATITGVSHAPTSSPPQYASEPPKRPAASQNNQMFNDSDDGLPF